MSRRHGEASRRAKRAAEPRIQNAEPPARSPADWPWALALTVLAWIHRLAFLRSNFDWGWPYTIFYEGDAESFFDYARALLNGQLYDNGIPFHPPGFAWVLAGVHALVGAGPGTAQVPYVPVKVVIALIGSLPVGLLYLLVRPYLGRTVALVASLLCAWSFGLEVIGIAPVTEGTYLTVLMLCLLLWTRRLPQPLAAPGEKSGGWQAAIGLGLLLGFLALIRAEATGIAAILVGIGMLSGWRRTSAAGLRPWLLVAVGWTLAVAPWTIRNAIVLSEVNQRLAGQLAEPLPTFVPLTVYGPINLALANNSQADGTFSRALLSSRSHAAVLNLTDPQHLEFLLHGDRMAWAWIRDHPRAFGNLVLRKWGLFFSAWKLGWTQWDWPGGLNGVRRPVDVFTPDADAGWGLGLPLAVVGLLCCSVTAGASRRWAILVLLLTAAGLASSGLFFGYVRQGLVLLPFWLTFTAAALVWIGEAVAKGASGLALIPSDPPRRLRQALGAMALVVLALELWGAGANRRYQGTGSLLPGGTLDRDQPVRLRVLPR